MYSSASHEPIFACSITCGDRASNRAIRAPLPVSSSVPYGEYMVPVPRGAALVVVATCSTSLRRGADYHARQQLILYTEVAFGEPREPPEDVRSKEPFFHVDE